MASVVALTTRRRSNHLLAVYPKTVNKRLLPIGEPRFRTRVFYATIRRIYVLYSPDAGYAAERGISGRAVGLLRGIVHRREGRS